MTCRELVDFLLDYDSGELLAAERARFEAHLGACPDCVAYLRAYRATVELGRAAFAELDAPVPDEVPEALVQAILAARARA